MVVFNFFFFFLYIIFFNIDKTKQFAVVICIYINMPVAFLWHLFNLVKQVKVIYF